MSATPPAATAAPVSIAVTRPLGIAAPTMAAWARAGNRISAE
jgi:hypothetical protein